MLFDEVGQLAGLVFALVTLGGIGLSRFLLREERLFRLLERHGLRPTAALASPVAERRISLGQRTLETFRVHVTHILPEIYELRLAPEGGRAPDPQLLSTFLPTLDPRITKLCPGDRWVLENDELVFRTRAAQRSKRSRVLEILLSALETGLTILSSAEQVSERLTEMELERTVFERLLRHLLVHHEAHPASQRALEQLAMHETAEVRFMAARALGDSGRQTLRALASSPEALDPLTRGELSELIAHDPDPRAGTILLSWLDHPNEEVRRKSLAVLGGRMEALSSINSMAFDRRGSLGLRTSVLETLATTYRWPQCSDAVLGILDDERNPSTLRFRAFELATDRGSRSQALSSLWPIVRRRTSKLRGWAIKQLAQSGDAGEIAELIGIARADDSALRLVLEASPDIGRAQESWLIELLEHRDRSVVAGAAVQLTRWGSPTALPSLWHLSQKLRGPGGDAHTLASVEAAIRSIGNRSGLGMAREGALTMCGSGAHGELSLSAPSGALGLSEGGTGSK